MKFYITRKTLVGVILVLCAIIAAMAMTGCMGSKSTTMAIERRVGTEQGQPTDLTITKQSKKDSEIVVPPATQNAISTLLTGLGIGGTGGLGLLALQWLRTRRAERDADEGWELAHQNALKVPPKAEG